MSRAEAADLLAWYDVHARALPWRVPPGTGLRPDPYRIWLSEVMLQQTTVAAVKAYFARFTTLWPTVGDLAAAPDERVMGEWAGLGYYARARNLIACARAVSAAGGDFPSDEKDLRALPGIGPYTAAAIRAAAFDRPASVVDGNVERVITRLRALPKPVRNCKPQIRDVAGKLADPDRPGDYAQAIMDLGATVCTPRNPDCRRCPWSRWCTAYRKGTPEAFPVKPPKTAKPHKHAVGFAVFRDDRIWLRKRPAKGLLGGMLEVPSTDWRATVWQKADVTVHLPFEAGWTVKSAVAHVFTHFSLDMVMWRAEAPDDWSPETGDWYAVSDMDELALPSLMKKAVLASL